MTKTESKSSQCVWPFGFIYNDETNMKAVIKVVTNQFSVRSCMSETNAFKNTQVKNPLIKHRRLEFSLQHANANTL